MYFKLVSGAKSGVTNHHHHAHHHHHHHHHHSLHFKNIPKRRKHSIDSNASFRNVCCCLFTNQKNDFYTTSRRKSILSSASSYESFTRQARLVGGHVGRGGAENGHLTNQIVEEATRQIKEIDEHKEQQASSRGPKCIRSFINNAAKRGGNTKQQRSEIIKQANSKSIKVGAFYLTFIYYNSIFSHILCIIMIINGENWDYATTKK